MSSQNIFHPSRSFIVKAPAGSGKTSLLISRMLSLLAAVDDPSQVLAITFTRKSTAEMRTRLSSILMQTEFADEETERLVKNLQQKFPKLADEAQLFSIYTIDGLCARIIEQQPVSSFLGERYAISESPHKLYQEASLNTLKELENFLEPHESQEILQFFHNNPQQLTSFLCKLLEQRLDYRNLLGSEASGNLANLDSILKKPRQILLQFFTQEQDLIAQIIENPEIQPEELLGNPSLVQICVEKLLTKKMEFRKKLEKYPRETKELFANFKDSADSQALADIALSFELLSLQQQALARPENSLLTSFSKLLEIAYAQLKLVFIQSKTTDFSEVAELALGALASNSYFGQYFKHLLVDEFQDTSILQLQLISKLTQEWSKESNSLFFVGDPMQSIYAFRGASVDIFNALWESGWQHNLHLELERHFLKTNYRSASNLVALNNRLFQEENSSQMQSLFSEVAFNSSLAHKQEMGELGFYRSEDQIQDVVNLVKQRRQKFSKETIGIISLNKSTQLEIAAALSKELADTSLVYDEQEWQRDLQALTQWAAEPSNQFAVLGLLRSHFFSLSLQQALDISQALLQFLGEETEVVLAGEIELQALENLKKLMNYRDKLVLQVNKPQVILKLLEAMRHSPLFRRAEALQESSHLLASLIGSLEVTWSEVLEKISSSQGFEKAQESQLEVLTIHASKGLEFDTLIVVDCLKKGRPDTAILKHLNSVSYDSRGNLANLSLYALGSQTSNPIAKICATIQNRKTNNERQRLTYVAFTRAKRNLFVIEKSGNIDNARLKTGVAQKLRGEITWESFPSVNNEVNETIDEQAKISEGAREQKPIPLEIAEAELQPVAPKLNLHQRKWGEVAQSLVYYLLQNKHQKPHPSQMPIRQICSTFAMPLAMGNKLAAILCEQLPQDAMWHWLCTQAEILIEQEWKTTSSRIVRSDLVVVSQDSLHIIDIKTSNQRNISGLDKLLGVYQAQLDGYKQAIALHSSKAIHSCLWLPLEGRFVYYSG